MQTVASLTMERDRQRERQRKTERDRGRESFANVSLCRDVATFRTDGHFCPTEKLPIRNFFFFLRRRDKERMEGKKERKKTE